MGVPLEVWVVDDGRIMVTGKVTAYFDPEAPFIRSWRRKRRWQKIKGIAALIFIGPINQVNLDIEAGPPGTFSYTLVRQTWWSYARFWISSALQGRVTFEWRRKR